VTAAAPITRATCWSVRQCKERAAQLLLASDDVVTTLDGQAEEFGFGPIEHGSRCAEHQAAVTQLDHLHTLVEHLLANLAGGFGAPATPFKAGSPAAPTNGAEDQTAKPLHRQAPTKSTAPKPVRVVTPPKTRDIARAQALAEGLIDMSGVSKLTGYSHATVQCYRSDGRLPKEHAMRASIPFWRPEQFNDIRCRPGGNTRGRRKGACPPDASDLPSNIGLVSEAPPGAITLASECKNCRRVADARHGG
jgi:predicted DNA-binding transcriptional regulator AlpA